MHLNPLTRGNDNDDKRLQPRSLTRFHHLGLSVVKAIEGYYFYQDNYTRIKRLMVGKIGANLLL